MAKLDPYRSKRDPARTPEPVPAETPDRVLEATATGQSFVVQEHHARQVHWDLRLERDGVLASWAVPKGLPVDPRVNRLAVRTEDHPLEYLDFEGDIPKGEYGAGRMVVWDRGDYELEKWSDREVKVVLHGSRVDGRYVLFKTAPRAGEGRGERDDQWMIHAMDAPPVGWEPMPGRVEPMLAVPGPLPTGDGWAYEFKWDGIRAIVHVEGARPRITSRSGRDISGAYPELRGLGEALGSHETVLDGEIVALDEAGRPSFSALQQRSSAGGARGRTPPDKAVTFMAFDLLYLDGRSTVGLPYRERRRMLEELRIAGPHWVTPPSQQGGGELVRKVSLDRDLEGVVAKRADSPYLPGKRSGTWVKVKNFSTQEVVVGGWSEGQGRREHTIGALLVGVPGEGGIEYVGRVGTGFSDAALDELSRILAPLERADSPFVNEVPVPERRGVTWVGPRLVGEVRFTEWTHDDRLRQASWRGLRPDKEPGEVVREQ